MPIVVLGQSKKYKAAEPLKFQKVWSQMYITFKTSLPMFHYDDSIMIYGKVCHKRLSFNYTIAKIAYIN